ncbi:DUF4252 domain-containing protein [Rufibacter quisquiliarum]|uniref:DUF4252 domain-containing protein n=1 Tax=Rufibacter quisquiliarum TaxID=1549639 RepID=A0A839GKV4_9BACT|nr:DUF4252 domain-containing protein [Rufibacter quisquiliarum]MBA9079300.1 hypothetical protein [Rufibacter quisquiliarum]
MTQPIFYHSLRRLHRLLIPLLFLAVMAVQSCSSTSNLPPAQTTTDFFQKYRDQAGFKGTSLPVGLVTRYLSSGTTDSTLKAALTNISSIRVLTFTPTNRKSQKLLDKGLTRELDQVLQKESYANLPLLDEAAGALQFKMRQANNQVQELVGYRKYGNNFLMLQVNGRFTRQQVEELLKKVDPDLLLPLLT